MSDVKWIKIVTDIFDDEKVLLIESLPEADSIIVIWFKLLCLAGKQNNSGVFIMNDKMPYDEKMFATIFRRKEMTVRLALQTFEQFGMIELINDTVTIPNWGKHQSIEQLEARRDYMKSYMKDYRESQKQLATDKCLRKHLRKQLVNTPDKIREEEIRVDKKRKEIYGEYENVKLTIEEYEKLVSEYPDYKQRIERLSGYIASKGDKYKSHYATIRNWAAKDKVPAKDNESGWSFAQLANQMGDENETE